jgi:hypothetical protein
MYDGVKRKGKKEKMDPFKNKIKESRNERDEKIDRLKKDLLQFLEKNKVDDRDAKVALQKVKKLIDSRCKIVK